MSGPGAPRISHLLVSVLVLLLALSGLGGVGGRRAARRSCAGRTRGRRQRHDPVHDLVVGARRRGGGRGYHWEVSRTVGLRHRDRAEPGAAVGRGDHRRHGQRPARGHLLLAGAGGQPRPGARRLVRAAQCRRHRRRRRGAGLRRRSTRPATRPSSTPWRPSPSRWSAVPGAVSYILQESTDPAFPVDTRARQVDIPGTTERISMNSGNQGSFQARVLAVNADGPRGRAVQRRRPSASATPTRCRRRRRSWARPNGSTRAAAGDPLVDPRAQPPGRRLPGPDLRQLHVQHASSRPFRTSARTSRSCRR